MAYGIEFNVDIASLERALDKMEKSIANTFSGNNLNQFDEKIIQLNRRIQNLAGNMDQLGIKADKSFVAMKQSIGEAVANLNEGNTALVRFSDLASKARNELNSALGAPAFKSAVEKLTYSGAGLSRLGELDPRYGANGFYSAAQRGGTSLLSMQTAGLDKDYKQAMDSMKKFYSEQQRQAEEASKTTKSFGDSIVASTIKWTTIGAVVGALYKGWENFNEAIKEGVVTIGEFQQQMVQLNSQMTVLTGKNAGVETSEILTSAMSLATAYGDNINDVAQNIALWRKQTKDLSSAVALTNESLKFQVATGTDLEDTYRTLTALSTQLGGTMVSDWDKTKFSLADTHKFLSMIYAAAITSGAGMRQIGTSGAESLDNMSNAAGILLHAMEQDSDAMRTLGLNVSQIIALNQALITAMGNTGQEADSAAERMARLVAGFAELSNSSKAKTLHNELGSSYDQLQKIVNATGDQEGKVVAIIKWYESLNTQQRNSFATTVASQRNYQQISNMAQALSQYEKNLNSEKNNGAALDDAAQKMNDTFLQQVQQLKGMWQGVVSVVGQELIPVLENVVQLTMQMAGGLGTILSYGNAGRTHDHDFINQAKYLKINPTASSPLFGPLQGALNSPFLYGINTPDLSDAAYFAAVKAQLRKEAANMNNRDSERAFSIINSSKDFYSMFKSLGYNRASGQMTPLLQEFAPEWMSVGGASEMGNLAYWSDPSNIKNLMKANMSIDAINNMLNKKDNSGLHLADPTGGSKAQTPGDMFGQAISDLTNQYHAYTQGIQATIAEEEAYLNIQKKKIDMFGPTASGLQNVLNLYKQEANTYQNSLPKLQQYQTSFANQLKIAQAHMNAPGVAKNSAEYKKWAEDADRARTSLSEVHKEIVTNGVKAMETYMNALDAVNAAAKRYYDYIVKIDEENVSTAHKSLTAGTGSFQDVVNAYTKLAADGKTAIGNMVHGSVEWQDAMQSMHDKGVQAIDDLKDKWDNYVKSIESSMTDFQSRGIEDAFSMLAKVSTPDQKSEYEYDKQLIKSQQELNKLQIGYYQDMKESGGDKYLQGLAQDLLEMGEATIALDDATAQYAEMVDQIKNSGIFQAFDKAFSELGSGVSTDITNKMFGNDAIQHQIENYDGLIGKLQQEKQWEDLLYSEQKNHSIQQEANHKLEIYMLDQQIKKQQELKKAEEDRLNHPALLKKFATTFTKGVIDDLVKQMEQSMENSILKAFMPKQDQQLITAMQAHVKGMQQNFQVPSEKMNKMLSQVFQPDIEKHFKDSTKMFDEDIKKVLKPSFDQFKVDMKDPFKTKMDQFHQDILNFAKAVDSFGTDLKSKGSSNGGSSTFNAVSLFAPTVMSNSQFSSALFAASGGASGFSPGSIESQLASTYLSQQTTSFQTSQALGGTSTAGLAGLGLGLAGAAGLSGISGGLVGGFGSGPSGMGGGFLNLLLSAGGGGTWAGAAGAGLGLVSAFSASQNKGDFALGSLGGVLGAGAIMSLMTGSTLFGSIGMAAMGGPIGIGILLGAALLGGSLGGMFGPHYNASTNPDMFGNSGFAQEVANAQGNAATQATGNVYEDPTMKQTLGGMSELQYLDAFVKAHPNGQGLSGAALQLWQQVNAFTHGGQAVGMHGLNQGNIGLSDSSNNNAPTYNNMPWQQLTQQVDQLTQSVLQFNNALNQGSNQLIAGFNQFGSGVGFFPYVWSIPGFNYPANPSTTSGPTSPGTPGAPGTPGSPKSGHPGNPNVGPSNGGPHSGPRTMSAYNYRPNSPMSTGYNYSVTNLMLDGKIVARSVQSYVQQTSRRGYSNIT